MTPPPNLNERLAKTPVTKLNFGNASLKRRVYKAGFSNILDLVNLSERELDSLFKPDDADTIIRLKEGLKNDFSRTAESLLAETESNREIVDAILAKASEEKTALIASSTAHQKISLISQDCHRHQEQEPKSAPKKTAAGRPFARANQAILPALPCAATLKTLESKIATLFDTLIDRYDEPLIYQLFSYISTDIDEIDDAFKELFNVYKSNHQRAIDLAEARLPNAFLVFVANRARNDYDDGNLWGNMFDNIGISDTNIQANFKQAFARIIEGKRLPLFAKDEETNFYFYTALLHGGLSYDSWGDLWASSLMPLARSILKNREPFSESADGHQILYELRSPGSRFSPKTSVKKILEKAPSRITAPLLEAGLEIAIHVEASKGIDEGNSRATLISSDRLPEAALQALASTEKQHHGKSIHYNRTNRWHVHGIIYLPPANLQLDLEAGEVYACWEKQQFPPYFANYAVEYRIGGKLMQCLNFTSSVGKCFLEETRIPLPPMARYEIELTLVAIDDQGEGRTVISSLFQTFTRNKPACFEFIKQSNGTYRLREKNERILKERTVAYVVKPGYSIQPKSGMEILGHYEFHGNWEGGQVSVFSVSPSASASIVDGKTGVEYAIWQERYIAKIDKTYVLGKTDDGADLYGFLPSSIETNAGLPSISIETLDGKDAIDNLDVTCIADGRRIAIPKKALWDEADLDYTAKIAFDLSKVYEFNRHAQSCTIEARQHSAGGDVVFRYRFAVIPIQEFRLASIDMSFGIAVAEYSFQLRCDADILNSQGQVSHVKKGNYWFAKTLLKDETLKIGIKTSDTEKATDAHLALAAIDLEIPDALAPKTNDRPINLAEALTLGASSGAIRITSHGRRRRRAVYACVGCKPFLLQEFKRAESHEFNVLADCRWLKPDADETPAIEPLTLAIKYGDDLSADNPKEAVTEIALSKFQKGYGFSSWKIIRNQIGERFLQFDSPIGCESLVVFKVDKNERPIGKTNIEKGSDSVKIPSDASKLIDRKRKLRFEIAPLSLFGDPLQEYATEYKLEGK